MNNLISHKVIFLTFFMVFITVVAKANTILPLPKPKVDQETKKIVADKKYYYLKKNLLNQKMKKLKMRQKK